MIDSIQAFCGPRVTTGFMVSSLLSFGSALATSLGQPLAERYRRSLGITEPASVPMEMIL